MVGRDTQANLFALLKSTIWCVQDDIGRLVRIVVRELDPTAVNPSFEVGVRRPSNGEIPGEYVCFISGSPVHDAFVLLQLFHLLVNSPHTNVFFVVLFRRHCGAWWIRLSLHRWLFPNVVELWLSNACSGDSCGLQLREEVAHTFSPTLPFYGAASFTVCGSPWCQGISCFVASLRRRLSNHRWMYGLPAAHTPQNLA